MKKSRSVKGRAKFERNLSPLSKAALVILFGAITTLTLAAILPAANSTTGVAAATDSRSTQVSKKRYKATRPIIVDRQTGQLRMPTKEEIDEAVQSLATLAKRPEGLQQSSLANGTVTVDLDGGFGGVMLARPNADGTWETKCVFTFEEGAEFLGVVEDDSQQ
jgi:hypothetical protein